MGRCGRPVCLHCYCHQRVLLELVWLPARLHGGTDHHGVGVRRNCRRCDCVVAGKTTGVEFQPPFSTAASQSSRIAFSFFSGLFSMPTNSLRASLVTRM